MKKKIIISIILIVSYYNVLCNECTIIRLDQKSEIHEYNPMYDMIKFRIYNYYEDYYKYPEHKTDLIDYLYNRVLVLFTHVYGEDPDTVQIGLELLFQAKFSKKQIDSMHDEVQILNYFIEHKDINIIYEDDYIIFECESDNNLVLRYSKIDICNDRSKLFDGSFCIDVKSKFYDRRGRIINDDNELKHNLYSDINDIVNYKYQQLWIDANKQTVTVILRYNKKNGLTSLCPNDNMDLKHNHFFLDVQDILDSFIFENKDVYEIILPIRCYETNLY